MFCHRLFASVFCTGTKEELCHIKSNQRRPFVNIEGGSVCLSKYSQAAVGDWTACVFLQWTANLGANIHLLGRRAYSGYLFRLCDA